MRDLPNLDVVRSIAVISVVVEHTLLAAGIQNLGPYPVAYLGVLGVLVFFVLTALVLMWSLERKPHTLDFYIRRWFRIYPLALAVIVVAVIFHSPTAGVPTAYFDYVKPTLRSILSEMSLLEPHSQHSVSVMWSLPYEVQMYLLLPAVFFFLRRNFSLWPIILIWALIVFDLRYGAADVLNFAVTLGYFLPGVMAYVGFGRWKPILPGGALPVFLAGMWAVFLYRFDFHKGWWFCLGVGLSLPVFRQIRSKWVLEPSRQIAKYSYGIYLMHPFAIVIGLYLLRRHSLPVRLFGEIVPLVVLPVLAYELLEHPMIRLGSRLAARAESRYEQRTLGQYRSGTKE